jgi:hypothetical protein
VQQAGNVVTAYEVSSRNFVFRDNITQFNRYGVVCQIEGPECGREDHFCNCFPSGVFRGNVFADNLGAAVNDNAESNYPSGNYFVSSYQRIGFADFAHGDWRLGVGSRTRKRGSDGRDPGVDLDALTASGVMAAREGTRVEVR